MWNCQEVIVEHNMKLWTDEFCSEIKYQRDRPSMTRGVSKIDPCMGLGTPLGCADGARLIWSVKHKRWAPPGVKVCGDAAVTCSCELFQRAEAIVVEG